MQGVPLPFVNLEDIQPFVGHQNVHDSWQSFDSGGMEDGASLVVGKVELPWTTDGGDGCENLARFVRLACQKIMQNYAMFLYLQKFAKM